MAFVASAMAGPGPCDLLDRSVAGQVLGQPVTAVTPAGPQPDEDTGGMLSFCTYQAGTSASIVSRVTFATAAAARPATTQELVAQRMADEDLKLEEEAGLGVKAYWSYTARGGQFVVV